MQLEDKLLYPAECCGVCWKERQLPRQVENLFRAISGDTLEIDTCEKLDVSYNA
jgi:hypothetical protein